MQDVSVLSQIENAWLKAYRSTGSRKHSGTSNHTQFHPCTMPYDILIIHRNAQSRWVSRLGKGLAVHPWLIPDMADSTKSTNAHILIKYSVLRIWNRTQQWIKHNYWEHLVWPESHRSGWSILDFLGDSLGRHNRSPANCRRPLLHADLRCRKPRKWVTHIPWSGAESLALGGNAGGYRGYHR